MCINVKKTITLQVRLQDKTSPTISVDPIKVCMWNKVYHNEGLKVHVFTSGNSVKV